MQAKLGRTSLTFTILVILFSSSVGCRTTRQSMSGLPGLGWVAPRDQMEFDELADSDVDEDLETPSSQAEPYSPTSVAQKDRKSTNESYPSTGFPSAYDRSKADSSTTGLTQSGSQKGFYNDKYESTATDDRYARDDYARDDYNSADAYGSTNTQSDYVARSGDSNSFGSNSRTDSYADSQTTPYEADYTADRYRDTPTEANSDASRYDSYADDSKGLVDSYGDSARNTIDQYGQRAQEYTQNASEYGKELVDRTQKTVDGYGDSLSDAYNSASDYVNNARENLGDQAQGLRDKVYDGVNGARDTAADRFNQFGQQANDSYERGVDALQNNLQSAREAVSNATTNAANSVADKYNQWADEPAESTENSATGQYPPQQSVTNDPRLDSNNRSSVAPSSYDQPWRPGTTSSYPANKSQDSSYNRNYNSVQPAGYAPR